MRPSAYCFQKDIIKNVPHAEGDRRITQAAPPGAAGENPDGQQHDQGGRFASQFDRRQNAGGGQGIGLIRFDAANQLPQVEHDRRLDPGHRHGINKHHQPTLPAVHQFSFIHRGWGVHFALQSI